MIFNAPPTQIRMMTQPVSRANPDPEDMVRWWVEGRAEPTQPADSGNLDRNLLTIRLRWPRLWRTGQVESAATP